MTKHAEARTQLKHSGGMVRQYSEPDNSSSSSESDVGKPPCRSRTSSTHLSKPRRNGRRGRGRVIRAASFSLDTRAIADSTELQHTRHTAQQQPANPEGLPSDPKATAMKPHCSVETSCCADPVRLASIEPPITKASLSELDLRRIINDSKLRHDLNFEVEIAFRPNYYGLKGEQKKAMASAYWTALAKELSIYIGQRRQHLSSATNLYTQATTRRLPTMFNVLREILRSLVPEAEWFSIEQALDVDFIMQQLNRGVCDLNGLIDWLGTLLMGSCSPCRDPTVLRMVQTVQQAVTDQDVQRIVSGIDQLFSILEIMKLVRWTGSPKQLRLLTIFVGRCQSPDPRTKASHDRRYRSVPTKKLPGQNTIWYASGGSTSLV